MIKAFHNYIDLHRFVDIRQYDDYRKWIAWWEKAEWTD
jgi:hypothetical protein